MSILIDRSIGYDASVFDDLLERIAIPGLPSSN